MARLIVGPGGSFRTIVEAVTRASAHDEILLTPAEYFDEVVTINKPLSISGLGGVARLNARHVLTDTGGVITTRADTRLSKIEIQGAHGLSGNASGIWHESGSLSVTQCIFRWNQNGILAARNPNSRVMVLQSTFAENGGGCGHTHGIYAADVIEELAVRECSFHDTRVGHHIKTKARQTIVVRSYLGMAPTGTTSDSVCCAYGGALVL